MLRFALFIALLLVVASDNEIPMFGMVGRSVRLPCNILVADPPSVEWSDMVWTSDGNPTLIFRSENNPEFRIEASHQNKNNYVIDSDFALTIDGLNMDNDPGMYTCRSVVGGQIHEVHYYLTVGELPQCSGDVYLHEGGSTTLGCQLTYSGQQPMLDWYHNGGKAESEDQFDIRLAKKVLPLVAEHGHDQTKFTCRMSLGDLTKDCSLQLNVTYLVRDIKFLPEKEKFRVGDELKCSAKGNPVPSVMLLDDSVQGKSGPGWHSIIVRPIWEGRKVTVQCTASNSVGSETEMLSSNLTIHVSASKKSTTHSTLPPTEEYHRVHHGRHTSTAPTAVAKREREHMKPGGHHKKHSTTMSVLTEEDDEQVVPAADNAQEVSRNAVSATQHANYDKTDSPTVIRTMEKKDDRQGKKENTTPETTGVKPVHSRSSEAGQLKHLGYSSFAVILIHRILTSF